MEPDIFTNVSLRFLTHSNFANLNSRKRCNGRLVDACIVPAGFWLAMCMIHVSRGLSVLLISVWGSEGLNAW